MICYDIVNPSDETTFLAPDRDIALAVVAFVGEGRYAGQALARDGKRLSEAEADTLYVPMFFDDGSFENWCQANGYPDNPLAPIMESRKAEVVAALRSCAYGDLEDRRTYDAACDAITDPDKLAEFKRACEDRRRSSMNCIVLRALAIADAIEKRWAA